MTSQFFAAIAFVVIYSGLSASFGSGPTVAEQTTVVVGCGLWASASLLATPIVASPTAVPFDLAFIDGLIQHQAAASNMANLGLQRAQDSDVRRTALRIVESQAGELQLLRTLRSSWYPNAAPTVTAQSTQAAIASVMPELCSTGDFDRVFLQVMIVHDRAGLEFVHGMQEQIQHHELRTFVNSYVETTRSEIRSMQSLLDRLPAATPVAG